MKYGLFIRNRRNCHQKPRGHKTTLVLARRKALCDYRYQGIPYKLAGVLPFWKAAEFRILARHASVLWLRSPLTEDFYVLPHGGKTMLLPATTADAHWHGLKVVSESCPKPDQKDRIIEALGPLGEHLPGVYSDNYFSRLTTIRIPG